MLAKNVRSKSMTEDDFLYYFSLQKFDFSQLAMYFYKKDNGKSIS